MTINKPANHPSASEPEIMKKAAKWMEGIWIRGVGGTESGDGDDEEKQRDEIVDDEGHKSGNGDGHERRRRLKTATYKIWSESATLVLHITSHGKETAQGRGQRGGRYIEEEEEEETDKYGAHL
ncbi:hypothetical protein C8R44DRAFT_729262 [Mycena epipterygia]|nr:hypothetical protein C8R44DRAFT_729262 [Mycena epipterygia]